MSPKADFHLLGGQQGSGSDCELLAWQLRLLEGVKSIRLQFCNVEADTVSMTLSSLTVFNTNGSPSPSASRRPGPDTSSISSSRVVKI